MNFFHSVTCHTLLVDHGELPDAGQHQVLDHLGRERRRVQDTHVALLQRQLPSLCAQGSSTGPGRRHAQGGETRARAGRGGWVAAEGSAPPQRRMLRSLRSELVMAPALDMLLCAEASGQNFFPAGQGFWIARCEKLLRHHTSKSMVVEEGAAGCPDAWDVPDFGRC